MEPCPICKQPAAPAFRSPYVSVAQCGSAKCRHLFATGTTPLQGVQFIAEPDSVATEYSERNVRLIRRLLTDGVLPTKGRVLDFGAGSGHFASALRDASGVTITCVEAEPASRARLKAHGFPTYVSLSEVQGSFDAVILTEVVEHVEDPVAILAALRSHLRDGGTMFLTTPCGETRARSTKTNAYETREHVHFFTERSLANAVKKAGFSTLKLRVLNEMYPHTRLSVVKDMLRPLRAALFGHRHLIGFVRA